MPGGGKKEAGEVAGAGGRKWPPEAAIAAALDPTPGGRISPGRGTTSNLPGFLPYLGTHSPSLPSGDRRRSSLSRRGERDLYNKMDIQYKIHKMLKLQLISLPRSPLAVSRAAAAAPAPTVPVPIATAVPVPGGVAPRRRAARGLLGRVPSRARCGLWCGIIIKLAGRRRTRQGCGCCSIVNGSCGPRPRHPRRKRRVTAPSAPSAYTSSTAAVHSAAIFRISAIARYLLP